MPRGVKTKQPTPKANSEAYDVSNLTQGMDSEKDTLFLADPWGSNIGEGVSYSLQQVDSKRTKHSEGLPYVDGNGTLVIPKEYGVSRASVFESAPNAGSVLSLLGLKVDIPRYPLHRVHNFLMTNPWHYACVEAKATAAAELGFAWEPTGDRYKPRPRIQSSQMKLITDFEDRIYSTNHKDLATILKDISLDYFSSGNYFIELVSTPLGKIDTLYSIPAVSCFRLHNIPAVCQILPVDENGLLPNMNSISIIESAMAIMPLFRNSVGNETILSALRDTSYSRTFRPNSAVIHDAHSIISSDPNYGIADVLPAISAILGDVATNDYNLQFFQHNAVPRYAVMIKGGRIAEEYKNHIVNFLNNSVLQQHHRTVVVPLGRGMDAEFQALDATPNEASFLKLKEMSRDEILAVHRVPPTKVARWDDANRSNGVEQDKDFYSEIIRPYQGRIERMMNRILESMGVTEYRFKFRDVSWEDEKAKASAQHVMALSAQVRITALTQADLLIAQLMQEKAIDEDRAQNLRDNIANKLDTAFEVALQYAD